MVMTLTEDVKEIPESRGGRSIVKYSGCSASALELYEHPNLPDFLLQKTDKNLQLAICLGF